MSQRPRSHMRGTAHTTSRHPRSNKRYAHPGKMAPGRAQHKRPMRSQQPNKTALAVVLVILLVAMLFTIRGCMKSHGEIDASRSTATSPFDWTNLTSENGRYAYSIDGEKVSRLGIDVSDAQGSIDWGQVADDGIDFAIVRVGYRGTTEGSIHADANFDYNIDEAKAAGLDVGVYFYSQAVSEDEAQEEARFVLSELNGRSLQYPIAFDFEETATHDGRADKIGSAQAAANARAFCREIESAGYKAVIYGNPQDLSDYDQTVLDEYPIWYAEYGSLPSMQRAFFMWQYTNEGSVAGVSTNVDMDLDLSKAL